MDRLAFLFLANDSCFFISRRGREGEREGEKEALKVTERWGQGRVRETNRQTYGQDACLVVVCVRFDIKIGTKGKRERRKEKE